MRVIIRLIVPVRSVLFPRDKIMAFVRLIVVLKCPRLVRLKVALPFLL